MQIIVLGMHRSGTSAATRIVNMMGAYFGPEGCGIGANRENPKGFWERRDIRQLNDLLLFSCGCDWDQPEGFDLQKVPREVLKQFRSEARNLILDLDSRRPWVIKEPRFCLTLPEWRRFLEVPVCLFVYRNPIEVAKSLQERNQLSLAAGLALWECYVLRGLEALRGATTIPISFNRLMRDPLQAVRELLDELTLADVSGLRMPSQGEINSFIDPALHHHNSEPDDQASLTPSQQELYAQLENRKAFLQLPQLKPSETSRLALLDHELSGRRKVAVKKQAQDTQSPVPQDSPLLARLKKQTRLRRRAEKRLRHEVRVSLALREELHRSFEAHQRDERLQRYLFQEMEALVDCLRSQRDEARSVARNYLEESGEKSLQLAELQKRCQAEQSRTAELSSTLKALQRRLHDENCRNQQLEKQRVAALQQEVGRLEEWIRQLAGDFGALLGTRRWRIGNAGVSLARRLLLRPRPEMVTDHIQKVLGRFHSRQRQLEGDPGGAALLHQPAPRAAIVICVHNAREYLEKCLQSVAKWTDLGVHQVVLVDDGSNDPETLRLLIDFSVATGARLLTTDPAQRGYSRAANQGIRASEGDYVVLLNSDTVVTPGWLEKLLRCAKSHPQAAVVGPLSNAASWQSIPVAQKDGRWTVNPPPAAGIETFAEALGRSSARIYPEVNFINGFCYLIRRAALDRLGLLDEEAFPTGYGEEDDFSIRSRQAGFVNLVADDCYVFHAKSKSFSARGRDEAAARSRKALLKKHGQRRIGQLVEEMAENEDLLRARTWSRLAGLSANESGWPANRECAQGLAIGWIQPHLGRVGGIRRVIEMTNRLTAWGNSVYLITPNGEKTDWLPIHSHTVAFSQANRLKLDALIVSDPDVVDVFEQLNAKVRIVYHLAAYMLYRPDSIKLRTFYGLGQGVLHIANSRWTAEKVRQASLQEIQDIIPGGVNCRLFRPIKTPKLHDVAFYGSKRKHKGTDDLVAASAGLRALSLKSLKAPQKDLARHICSAHTFASGCWHEGFNFCPLEAMACGVPVVLTDDGGSREYARDGKNSLIVAPRDRAAISSALRRLLEDKGLRMRLIEEGIETAWRFDWDEVSRRLLGTIFQARRSAVGKTA